MSKKGRHSLLEIIGGMVIILSFPAITVMFALASNNIISTGIPIITFGALFILIPLFGKDVDNSLRNRKIGKIIFIPLGMTIVAIGISIIYKSIAMFIYSFISIFGISGLLLVITLVYTYLYNKKYCTKKYGQLVQVLLEIEIMII